MIFGNMKILKFAWPTIMYFFSEKFDLEEMAKNPISHTDDKSVFRVRQLIETTTTRKKYHVIVDLKVIVQDKELPIVDEKV